MIDIKKLNLTTQPLKVDNKLISYNLKEQRNLPTPPKKKENNILTMKLLKQGMKETEKYRLPKIVKVLDR